jgi:hypothetical protein
MGKLRRENGKGKRRNEQGYRSFTFHAKKLLKLELQSSPNGTIAGGMRLDKLDGVVRLLVVLIADIAPD